MFDEIRYFDIMDTGAALGTTIGGSATPTVTFTIHGVGKP